MTSYAEYIKYGKYFVAIAVGLAGITVGLVMRIPTLVSVSCLVTGAAHLLGSVEYVGSLPDEDPFRAQERIEFRRAA